MRAREGIGQRIAAYRRRRGVSQAALAGLVGRSESWLGQVERGIRSVDRLSVLVDLAEILHVDVADLVGRPWRLAPNGGPLIDGLDRVRYTLTAYPQLAGRGHDQSMSDQGVDDLIDGCHRDYQAGRYGEVIARLPALLADIDQRPASYQYVAAYTVTAKLTTKLGAADLAWIAADRAAAAATEIQAPAGVVARGLAAYQVVCALLRGDQNEHAEQLAVAMAESLEADNAAVEQVAVCGSLWLIAAVIAARRSDRGEAWARLGHAGRLAVLIPAGAENAAWTAFCSPNVGIHRVSVATEMGDAGDAAREAQSLDLTGLPEGLRSRRAQVHLDLAWAEAHRRRDTQAVQHLLDATAITPDVLRFNVMARELSRELISRGRASTEALDQVATHAAILV